MRQHDEDAPAPFQRGSREWFERHFHTHGGRGAKRSQKVRGYVLFPKRKRFKPRPMRDDSPYLEDGDRTRESA